jgi:hypothetical protein
MKNRRENDAGTRGRADAAKENLLIDDSVTLRRKVPASLRFRLCASIIICILIFPVAFAGTGQQRGAVVDQIIALVNEDVITRSDLLWSIALAPDAPSPAGPISSDILQRKLEVMIDERLLAQEAARVPSAPITEEDILNRRASLVRSFPSEAAFRERVEAVGLTPERINELIRQMILIERFNEFRFRSFVLVTDTEIQRYYNETFAAEMRRRGAVPPGLDDRLDQGTVREQIQRILQTEKIIQETNRWLEAARQRADIVHLAEP